MVDRKTLTRLADYAELQRSDVVLEVGAGFGFLTEVLAERAGKVVAVESDPKLCRFLSEKFGNWEKIDLRQGDFLKMNLEGCYNKVVSNPPYSIASSMVFKLLEETFGLGVFTFQAEFAERMVAKAGEKTYGRLSVMVYAKAEVELLEPVPSEAFYPRPKVSSWMVRIRPRKKPPFQVKNWSAFEEAVRLLFTQKNRKLCKALRVVSKTRPLSLEKAPHLERRVFTLTPEELGEVSNAVFS